MSSSARRFMVRATLAIGGMNTGQASLPVSAQSCDPAYVSYCVPAYAEVGDLNRDYFYSKGIAMIQLADPYNDPHGLDGWGCEGGGY
jgi:hypothetical protein